MTSNLSLKDKPPGFDPRKGTMIVFNHNPWKRLSAFKCGDQERAVVVVGGLADTFFSLNYIDQMTEALAGLEEGYCVVQPLFSSAYAANTDASLENDNEDLDCLLSKLHETGVRSVALLGYSTGAQDALNYLESGHHAGMVKRLILQGGLCDPNRDSTTYESKQQAKDRAMVLIRQGLGNTPMPASAYPGCISAFRYMALGGRHCVMDFFNPLQCADDMAMVLGHVRVPCLVIFCLSVNYDPSAEERNEVAHKIQEALPADVKFIWLPAACDENLNFMKGFEDEVSTGIANFLSFEDQKERERELDKQRDMAAEERRKRSVVFAVKSGSIKRSPSQVSVCSHNTNDTRHSVHG